MLGILRILTFQIKLLTRFLSTDFGQILLDGVPHEKYDKKSWRQVSDHVRVCVVHGDLSR